ncbi:MAG: regulatory protein RecX [Candidatus Zixiibacteriota bacterium]
MARDTEILSLKVADTQAELIVAGDDRPLLLPADSVATRGLAKGARLSAALLGELRAESDYFLCERDAARMLAMREHSVGELRDKLQHRKHARHDINKAVLKYRRQGLLDDARYARRTAENLLSLKPCGQVFVVATLRRKRIGRQLAEEIADEVCRDQDETELAVAALAKRWNALKQFDLEVARRKAYSYLSRRGFGYEAARTAFEELQRRQNEVPSD